MRAPFFVTAATGTADLLAAELAAIGIEGAREVQGGVACEGSLADAYRACLESRVGLRVLWQLARFPVADAAALYAGVRAIDWSGHLDADGTLAVDFAGSVPGITHTQFGAQRVKDAVVDQFRDATGTRPSVDRESPAIRINAHAARGSLTIAIDLSGESLHRRGYRGGQGAAPLKENLAAAILVRAGWPAIAAADGHFVDPMCGSGTLPIEAAWIALRRPPGLTRKRFGFQGGLDFDVALWTEIRDDARRGVLKALPAPILGFDLRRDVADFARTNAKAAGIGHLLKFEAGDIESFRPPEGPPGTIIVNPPYGERLGEETELRPLYAAIGAAFRRCPGWRCWVFTGNGSLARRVGLPVALRMHLFNGRIACQFLRYETG